MTTEPTPSGFPTEDEIDSVADDMERFARRRDGWQDAQFRLAAQVPVICAAARDRNRLERALRDIASGDCPSLDDAVKFAREVLEGKS